MQAFKRTFTENIIGQRGWFLIIMILFLVVGDLQIPYYLANPEALKTIYSSVPSWYAVYAVIGLASNVAIIIGMWRMRKWSVYLLTAYFPSKMLVDSMYVLPSQWLTVLATTVIGAGFWFWAIYRKWSLFT